LGSVVKEDEGFVVYVGNKKITSLSPQYFELVELCKSENKFDVIIDGKKVSLEKTSDINVKDNFNIVKRNGYRVNIIGFKAKDSIDESGVSVKLKDFDKKYSIDTNDKVYRVEFYKNDKFCFMSKVNFK
jgi:hypothetical protein